MATTQDRVAPRLARPDGFYSTRDLKGGEKLFVGAVALIQAGLLVDATGNLAGGGTPVMVDRSEDNHLLDATNLADGEAKARVISGEAFLMNVDTPITVADEEKIVYLVDNDTVSLDDSAGARPKIGRIVRMKNADQAYVLIFGLTEQA